MRFIKVLLLLIFATPAWAVLATPVTISSIAVSGSVATVTTSSAHSIPANNPGFCILGSSVTADNVCGTAASITSTTVYTFNFPSGVTIATCSTSCGTSQPSPLFVIRGNQAGCVLGKQCVTYCEYNFTSVGLPLSSASTGCASAYTTTALGANAATLLTEMNSALASGQIVETPHGAEQFPSSYTSTQIQNKILDIQLADQTALGAANSPGGFIGKACDVTGCN